jgi:type II secretory pathway pseudopilin PulG
MPITRNNARRRKQAGYSLLMVVFLVATVLILAATAVPNVLVQGRREREEEMIWRGEQYQRAIGMYFRKFGKYPTKVDDLVKQTNGVRFLRQAYTDPMNKEDGSWRFIYVGPNGQLIGTLRSASLLQSVLSTATMPGATPFGTGAQPPPPPGANTVGTPGAPGQTGQQASGALAPNPLASQPQPLQGSVIGGNIIGVGSKVKQSSLRIYQGGDTYEHWEFIWNPLQQVAIPGQQAPVNPNAPAVPTGPQPPGQPAPGIAPPSPGAPPPSPDNPSPTIQPQQNPTNQ